jgi:hypothetical protein
MFWCPCCGLLYCMCVLYIVSLYLVGNCVRVFY